MKIRVRKIDFTDRNLVEIVEGGKIVAKVFGNQAGGFSIAGAFVHYDIDNRHPIWVANFYLQDPLIGEEPTHDVKDTNQVPSVFLPFG